MSRVKPVKYALPYLALAGLVACAGAPGAQEAAAAPDPYEQAIAEALAPATAEERERAERSDPLTRANFWAGEYKKNRADLETTVKFLMALRAINSHDRVRDVASEALPLHPQAYEIYLELGRSLLADGKTAEAVQAFVRSADFAPETEATPLAALGVAFDRMENHKQAQEAYEIALQREPDRISTLSNYGMSLALTGNIAEAEQALRRAAALPGADVRIRQNLALILGLQGRFDDMAEVDPSAPQRTIEANRRVLEDMMRPMRDYSHLQDLDTVIQDELARASASEKMPDLKQAVVESEAMPLPAGDNSAPNDTSVKGATLDGAPAEPKTVLRPKLRGSQGR